MDPDLDPDPYWIRIQELSGSGSGKMKANDVRFKIKIHNSETQPSKNFFW